MKTVEQTLKLVELLEKKNNNMANVDTTVFAEALDELEPVKDKLDIYDNVLDLITDTMYSKIG